MDKKTVRTGIVGAGFAATFHFESLKKVHSTNVEVEGVFATDSDQAAEYANQRGIKAYDSLDALVATTTTDAVGYYEFTGVPPGTYTVEVAEANFAPGAVLDGWHASPVDRGGDDALDSDGDEAAHTATVTVAAGETSVPSPA